MVTLALNILAFLFLAFVAVWVAGFVFAMLSLCVQAAVEWMKAPSP